LIPRRSRQIEGDLRDPSRDASRAVAARTGIAGPHHGADAALATAIGSAGARLAGGDAAGVGGHAGPDGGAVLTGPAGAARVAAAAARAVAIAAAGCGRQRATAQGVRDAAFDAVAGEAAAAARRAAAFAVAVA